MKHRRVRGAEKTTWEQFFDEEGEPNEALKEAFERYSSSPNEVLDTYKEALQTYITSTDFYYNKLNKIPRWIRKFYKA